MFKVHKNIDCVDFNQLSSILSRGWVMALQCRPSTGLITISFGLNKDGLLALGQCDRDSGHLTELSQSSGLLLLCHSLILYL